MLLTHRGAPGDPGDGAEMIQAPHAIGTTASTAQAASKARAASISSAEAEVGELGASTHTSQAARRITIETSALMKPNRRAKPLMNQVHGRSPAPIAAATRSRRCRAGMPVATMTEARTLIHTRSSITTSA
ncbi:hypothetical protein [Aeromicrobium sp. UC242_57]|uniref:hypothetical protein n=1 Tax=Aeromicrobium sp. UC242_57 TaxID=3374624 RepID=UPI0037899081